MMARAAQQRTTVTINGTTMKIWVTPVGTRGFFNSHLIEASAPTLLEAAVAWQAQATSDVRPAPLAHVL